MMTKNPSISFWLLVFFCFSGLQSQTLNTISHNNISATQSLTKYSVTSNDPQTKWVYNQSSVQYFIVSEVGGSSNKSYTLSNGFNVEIYNRLYMDIPTVELYRNTSVTVCIDVGNCPNAKESTFYISPMATIDYIKPISTRGGVVTIVGKYFFDAYYIFLFKQDFPVPNVPSTTTERYFTISDDYSGVSYSLSITLNGITLVNDVHLYFIAPSIERTQQTDNQYQIHGDSFGKMTSLINIYIGGVLYKDNNITMSVFNHSMINFTLPQTFQPQSTNIKISVNDNPSNINDFKIAPTIHTLSTIGFGGGNLTITGSHIVVVGGVNKTRIRVGDNECINPVQIVPGESMYCLLGPSFDTNVILNLSINGVVSNNMTFSYQNPRIDSSTQNGPIFTFNGFFETDSKITFNGQGISFSPSSQLINSNNPLECTQLVFNLTNQPISSGLITIGKSKQTPPLQLDIVPYPFEVNQLPTEGGSLAISIFWVGSNRLNVVNLIGIGECNYPQQSQQSPLNGRYEYRCDLPPGAGKDLPLVLLFNQISSSLPKYNVSIPFSYLPPSMSDTPQYGDKLHIIGKNFGIDPSKVFIRIVAKDGSSNTIVGTTKITNHTEFAGKIPNVQDGFASIIVGGQESLQFQYKNVPTIITPINSSSTDGGMITITGVFFGKDQFSVNIGTYNCTNVTVESQTLNNTILTCLMPPGDSKEHLLTISSDVFNNQTTNPLYLYNYQPPTIISTTTISGGINGTITIKGSNFGIEHMSIVTIGSGNHSTPCINMTVFNSSSLTCSVIWKNRTQPIQSTYQLLKIETGNQSTNKTVFLYYNVFVLKPKIAKRSLPSLLDKKWLVPIILIPSLLVAGILIWGGVVLMKKFKKADPQIQMNCLEDVKTIDEHNTEGYDDKCLKSNESYTTTIKK